MIHDLIRGTVLLLLLCSAGFCVLSLIAAIHYLFTRRAAHAGNLPVSVLKPLAGLDERLEENLRSFFLQDHPEFELIFAIHSEDDPAATVVLKLQEEYPQVTSQLVITGENHCPNPKIGSLRRMLRVARHSVIVASDSDVWIGPDTLRIIAAELASEDVGLVTCPYRAVAGKSIWSVLEALGMNSEFIAGVLTARFLEGMKFALGAVIAVKRPVLDQLGGFERLQEYLADDFVLGKFVAAEGYRVLLSSCVVEHRIGSAGMVASISHRLRWNRSTRRSRPIGYIGQIFTNPVAIALLWLCIDPAAWTVAASVIGMRLFICWFIARFVLGRAKLNLFLIPIQDVISFAVWVAGFFGNEICWRDATYRVLNDGKLEGEFSQAAAGD